MKKAKHINEFEMYQAALSRIRLNEAAIPLHNGKIVEDADTYSKVERLLACPEMEQSHAFLYGIDFDQLDDDTVKKVDELYDLAIKQGLLEIDNQEEMDATSDMEESPTGVTSDGDVTEILPTTKNMVNCYTCFYSAIKNGEIKTGECYSNAPTPEQAKVDAISKLTQIGFSDINIIAIETGDTDVAECDVLAHTVEKSEPKDFSATPITNDDKTITEDVPMVAEDDGKEENKEEEEKKEDTEEEKSEKAISTKELSHQEKVELFTKFFKTFKDLLIKMKQTSYKNLDIDGKAEFWNNMSNIWNEKYDPREFMSPANIEKLENMEVKVK